jgi:cysteinyl-tRNA synthetase
MKYYPLQILNSLDDLYGLDLAKRTDISTIHKKIISEREKARAGSQWKLADTLRNELSEAGIELKDLESGTIWHRK